LHDVFARHRSAAAEQGFVLVEAIDFRHEK
jgi:hypothetical protein